MEKGVTAQDVQIIEKMKKVIPKLSPYSKDKLLTAVDGMAKLPNGKTWKTTNLTG